MLNNFLKSTKGVITILVSLMLVGVLSIGTLVIESGRYQAAKTQLAEANISASTSMIAAYDSELYARYGLLAIDTERFTPQRATDYLNFNTDQAVGYRGNRLSRLYVVDSVELTGLYNLTYPSILKRQILSRARYHIVPQDNTLNLYTMDSIFSDFQNKCKYVANQFGSFVYGSAGNGSIDDVPSELIDSLTVLYETYADLEKYDDKCNVILNRSTMDLLPSVTGTVENNAPAEDVVDINTALANVTTVLGASGSALNYNKGTIASEINVNVSVSFVPEIRTKLKDVSSATNITRDTKDLAVKIRAMAQGFNAAINALGSEKEENLLLNSYIAEYFSNRNYRIKTYSAPLKGTIVNGTMDNATFSSACIEYVFGGKASERTNQQDAYTYLQAIRLINNLYAVMTTSDSFDAYNSYSVAAHLAWANYESIIDMELLTTYNVSVPFNKNKMILPINDPETVTEAFSSLQNTEDTANALRALGYYNGTTFVVSGSNTFSYKDSLSFALWFVSNSKKLLRVSDLIQLEMRYHEQYVENKTASFLMSEQNTYCRVKCIGKFNAILPIISLDQSNSARGISFQSIKYAGY